MPHKAFLKKKSLLDRFKDDHARTGYIQSARAEHTWNNPITRRKRTKELNGWIKSFAGKNHIRKLSRFNAQQAGRYEALQVAHPDVEFDCLRYADTLELPNGVCVKVYPTIRCPRRCAFVFRVMGFGEVDPAVNKNAGKLKYAIHGYYPVYGLERQPSEEFDIYCDDVSELQKWSNCNGWGMGVGPSASSMEAAREVAKGKETMKNESKNETKFDPSQYDFFKASYTLDGTNRVKKTNGIVDAQGTLDMAQRHGATNLKLVGVTDDTETDIPLSDVGISESKNEAMSLKGFLEALEEKLVKQFDLDEDEVKSYLDAHTQEMQELLDDKEMSLKEKVLFVRGEITGEKDEAKEPADEKLGYEKGHKNSKGEDAPWVIRSHEDNRILASFAKKEDAEEHLQRMKQYSKKESRTHEALETYACFIDFETEADAKKGIELVKGWKPVIDGTAVVVSGLDEQAANRLWGDWKKKCSKAGLATSDEGEVYKEDPSNNYNGESKKSEKLFNKAELERYAKEQGLVNEAVDLRGFTNLLRTYNEKGGSVKNGVWRICDGAYDLWFELYYKEQPILGCTDNVCKWYSYPETVGMTLDDYKKIEDKIKSEYFAIDTFKMPESKQTEASNLAGYTSDVISELDVIWACGEDGAKRLADKYSDTIQQNYTDGDLLASETAKFIAEQENLTESCKKQESRKSEVRLELIDTIVVPKWLWEAYNFGNEYGEDLDEHEQNILSEFQEKYADCHLDDEDEESYFSSYNDFDSYGGQCFTVKVYKEKLFSC